MVKIGQKNRTIKKSSSDRLFYIGNTVFLFLWLAVIAVPLLHIISQSISDPDAVLRGQVILFPIRPSLVGYRLILDNTSIVTGFINSIIIAISGTVLSVVLTIMAAYPLSRKTFYGRRLLIWLFTFTMMFNGGLIPTYLVVRAVGLINTRLALILPNAVAAFYVIVARTFFTTTIPEELYDATRIDGCSDIRTFSAIVLPLSKPIIAVLTLFYAVGIWNAYFDALIYLRSQEKFPLQLVLRSILISSELQSKMLETGNTSIAQDMALAEVLKYAVIVVSSLPLLILYPFIQKHFIKGVMIGAIKG